MYNIINFVVALAMAARMDAQSWAVWYDIFPDGEIKFHGAPFGGDVPVEWVRFTHDLLIPQKG